MAQAFLRELLQVQNRVQPEEDQECVICRETAGTMSQETGYSETAVRTSCGHIVGSGCIAKWLRENNTCPMCRHEFFPAQSPAQSFFDHDDMEGQSDRESFFNHDDDDDNGFGRPRTPTARSQILNGSLSGITDYLGEIKRLCETHCDRLRLQPGTAQIALYVFSNLLNPGTHSAEFLEFEGENDDTVIAVSIYIASYLTRRPKHTEEIARAIWDSYANFDGISYDIHELYSRNLYNYRDEIVDDGIRYELDVVFNVRTLNWPPVVWERPEREEHGRRRRRDRR